MGFERPITPNTRAPSIYPRNPVTNPLNGLLDSADSQMPAPFTPQSRPVGYPSEMEPMPSMAVQPEAPQQRQSVWQYPTASRQSAITDGLLDDAAYEPMQMPTPQAQAPARAPAPAPARKSYAEAVIDGLSQYERAQLAPARQLDPLMYRALGPVRAGGGYV
jgi:hypothetical protein